MRISRKHYKDTYHYIYLEVKLINHNNLCIHLVEDIVQIDLVIDSNYHIHTEYQRLS